MMNNDQFKKLVQNSKVVKLDVGCGPHKKVGYIGIDILPMDGVDFLVDFNKESLPIDNNSVDEIYTSHFLEHVENPVKLMEEFNRILKDGGILEIIVPHYTNPYAHHFTHKTYWSSYAFEQEYLDYYLKSNLILVSKKIKINSFALFDPIFNSFANNFLSLYERFFSSFIKAWEISFILRKNESKRTFIQIN